MAINENEEFEFRARMEMESQGVPFVPPQKKKLSVEDLKRFSGFNTTPIGVMSKLAEKGQQGVDKAAEFVSTEMARRGTNPYVAAGIGTLGSIAPDIMMTAGAPVETASKAVPAAIGPMTRALGFKSMFRQTPFARGKAAEAAAMALENRIMPLSGSPQVALQKLEGIGARAGQKIGDIRESVGPLKKIDTIINQLDEFKAVRTKGRVGGEWDKVNNRIENAKETLKGLVVKGKGVTLKDVAEAKKELSSAVNWMADNSTQKDTKKIAMSIEKGIEKVLKKEGKDVPLYKELKKTYGAVETAKKGLNKEVAAQEGNMGISLPSIAAGAIGGNPIQALSAIGATELLKRRGAGVAARAIQDIGQSPATIGLVGSNAVRAIQKVLTESKAKQYLKQAKKENPGLSDEKTRKIAREKAIKDGWDIPE